MTRPEIIAIVVVAVWVVATTALVMTMRSYLNKVGELANRLHEDLGEVEKRVALLEKAGQRRAAPVTRAIPVVPPRGQNEVGTQLSGRHARPE